MSLISHICHQPLVLKPNALLIYLPPYPLWVEACPYFISLSSFLLLPSCIWCPRAAACVSRCIALLMPKSLTPMGQRCGWARTLMKWFTPVLSAKSWLKAIVANEDMAVSDPARHSLSYKHQQCLNFPHELLKSVPCSAWVAEWRYRWGKKTPSPIDFSWFL